MAPSIAMELSPNVLANIGQRNTNSISHTPASHSGDTGDAVLSEHVNDHGGVNDTSESDTLFDQPDWEDLDPYRQRAKMCEWAKKHSTSALTQPQFMEKYGPAIDKCLVIKGDADSTLIEYIIRKSDPWDFDDHEDLRHLVTATLSHLQARLGESGLSSPPVLVHAINGKHLGFIKIVCDAAKDDKIKGLVSKAIAAESSGQNCLHAAIQKNIPLEIVDMLIEHGDKTAFSGPTHLDGNTPLHELVKFESRLFSVACRKCPKRNCHQCRSDAKMENTITDEQQAARRCVETLRRMIDRYPGALSATSKDGKTPYVLHIEERNRAKPEWTGLEYGDKPEQPLAGHVPETDRSFPRSASVLQREPLPPGDLDANTSPDQAPKDDKRLRLTTDQRLQAEKKRSTQSSEHLKPEWNKSRHLAQKVAQELLKKCSSRTDFEEAVQCIFGTQTQCKSRFPESAVSNRPFLMSNLHQL